MGRKKILYSITKSDPWGGAQKYVYELATQVAKEYDVVVALGGNGPLKHRLEEAGIRVRIIKAFQRDINIWKEFRAGVELFHILRGEHPDVVHLNSSKAGGLGAFIARCTRVPRIIFTAHGWAFMEPRGRLARWVIALFSWLTVWFTHITITVSEYHRAKAGWMVGVRHKLVAIHNGIEHLEYLDKTEARRELAEYGHIPDGLWQHKIWIGTISELHRNKGLSYLLYAVDIVRREYTNILVVIISDGEERVHLEEITDRLNLRTHVFFTGYVTDAARYISALDIFTLTSLKEGLPYTILEAGSAGVPVVASGIDGIPEIITDMESGMLVKPRRPDEIAQALSYLISDPDKRATLGGALQQVVEKDFSQESMVSQTIRLYEGLDF